MLCHAIGSSGAEHKRYHYVRRTVRTKRVCVQRWVVKGFTERITVNGIDDVGDVK